MASPGRYSRPEISPGDSEPPRRDEVWSALKLTLTVKQLLKDFGKLEATVEALDDSEQNSAVIRAKEETERALIARYKAEAEARDVEAKAKREADEKEAEDEKAKEELRKADREFLIAFTKQMQKRAAIFALLASLAGAGITWLVSHWISK